jgi:polygalacturonase
VLRARLSVIDSERRGIARIEATGAPQLGRHEKDVWVQPKGLGLGVLLCLWSSLEMLGCGSASPPAGIAGEAASAGPSATPNDPAAVALGVDLGLNPGVDLGAVGNTPASSAPLASTSKPAGDQGSGEGGQPVSGLTPGSNGNGAGSSNTNGDAPGSDPIASPPGPEVGVASPPSDGVGTPVPCAVDADLPAEPKLPATVCATLNATHSAASGSVPPNERTLDTARIQAAIDGCTRGGAVRLVTQGDANAFVSAPLALRAGVALWVDTGATLYASRQPALYGPSCGTTSGSCPAFIAVSGAGSSIVGDGVIDGQGGEKMLNPNLSEQAQSWWELSDSIGSTDDSAANPALLQTSAASTRFTLYRISLHNSPKFHARLAGNGFLVWGVTVFTPSTPTNSHGTALAPDRARDTDGIDPGAGGAVSNGYILYSKISVGADQIAIKGSNDAGADYATQLVIAHNHFGSGHGMSIGSEVAGGVHDVSVCDLTIDNSLRPTGGSTTGDANGIRVKSDPTRGGLVNAISYSDVCMRELNNPIVVDPFYSTDSGDLPPVFTNLTFQNVRAMSTGAQAVTLLGLDRNHLTTLTLDNVTLEGPAFSVEAGDAVVTLGPGGSSFAKSVSGNRVQVLGTTTATPTPVDCGARWVSIP